MQALSFALNPTDHIPYKIKLIYRGFKIVSQTAYYVILAATSLRDKKAYMIRVLDRNSSLYRQQPNETTSLFIQEMFHLGLRWGTAILEDFTYEDGNIAFVTKPDCTIFDKDPNIFTLSLDKLLKDVLDDLSFLKQRMNCQSFRLDPNLIRSTNNSENFAVTDWSQVLLNNSIESRHPQSPQQLEAFAISILQRSGVSTKEICDLNALAIQRSTVLYNEKVDSMLEKLYISGDARQIIKKILEKDIETYDSMQIPNQNLYRDVSQFEEEKVMLGKQIKAQRIQTPERSVTSVVESMFGDQSPEALRKDPKALNSLLRNDWIESISRLAWSTFGNNEVCVYNRELTPKVRSYCGLQLTGSNEGSILHRRLENLIIGS